MERKAVNPILTQYEELLHFRLLADDGLQLSDMIELLEGWYQLRRSLETPPITELKINPVEKKASRQKKNEECF